MKRKKMARQTLGELLGKQKESESQVAASLLVPREQPGGLGVPFLPQEDIIPRVILGVYAQGLMTENQLHTSMYVVPHPPGLETGILSTEGNDVYTVPERFPGDEENDPIENFKATSTGFFQTSQGKATTFDAFTKNSRGELPEGVRTGHDLLSKEGVNSIPPAKPSDRKGYKDDTHYGQVDATKRPIAAALHDTLVALNKYTPTQESPFLDYSEKGDSAFVKGLYSIQRDLGAFDKDAESLSIAELRKVGGELLFKAQSISAADSRTLMNNFTDDGGYGFTTDLMVLIPHLTQIGGGTVDVSNLKARVRKGSEILATGQDDLIAVQSFETTFGFGQPSASGSDTLISPMNGTSNGTMNSPVEPFDGVFPAGMALPVVYSIIVVGLFGQWILPSVISGLKDTEGPSVKDPTKPWTMSLGRNYEVDDSFTNGILELLGLPRTNGGSFFGAMMAGLMLFYGLEAPVSPFSTFGPDFINTALNLIYSPGYYLVMVKGILRDMATILNTISNLGNLFDSGIFGAITSLFTSFEVILKSYTFRFFMVMTRVGDQAIKYMLRPGLDGHGGKAITYDKQKEIAILDPSLHRTALSRFHKSPGEVKSPLSLTLQHGAFLPSTTNDLIPGVEPLIASDFGEKALEKSYGLYTQVDAINRLGAEVVDAIESKIDSEYVPFSIQDLRTNEIFSLPAFITSISDDFSVQHATSHGYGRTDPVYAHSKTTRSINLVFNLVSMNEEDHSYMYHILNKLVSMCYPQRDGGIPRKQGAGPGAQYFIQPFSQTPIASPIIRLRLGDLIKTNKSSLALEKLFGGTEILQLKGDIKAEEIQVKTEELSKSYAESRKKIVEKRREKLAQWNSGNPEVKGKVFIPQGTQMYVKSKDEQWYSFETLVGFETKVTKAFATKGPRKTYTLQSGETSVQDTIFEVEIPKDKKEVSAIGGKALASAAKEAESSGGLAAIFGGGDSSIKGYILPSSCTPIWFDDYLDPKGEAVTGVKAVEDIEQFLNTETNPVARSFLQSSPGKGLACVITTLSLSYEGALWGTGNGDDLTAPMRVQINMSVAPIHDAPLGLNSRGDIFAPSHPVGFYSPGTGPNSTTSMGDSARKTKLLDAYQKAKKNAVIYTDKELSDPSKSDALI